MREFAFEQQLDMSAGVDAGGKIGDVLRERVPGATAVVKASKRDDRNGTDYWIERRNGHALSVDCKVRTLDPVERFGLDDLALETWSVVEARRVGWSLDESKRTDYVLWWFSPTSRWCLIPFPQLLYSFRRRAEGWKRSMRVERQRTVRGEDSWTSECVYVPRRDLWAAIYDDFSGRPPRRT